MPLDQLLCMLSESGEHAAIVILSQVQERRVMPDHSGEVRSNQRLIIEPKHRQGHVIYRIPWSRETRFQTLMWSELAQVFERDANARRYCKCHILDRFSIARHFPVRVAQEEANSTAALPQAGRTRAWFPTAYGVQTASEWPEMRGHRPSKPSPNSFPIRPPCG